MRPGLDPRSGSVLVLAALASMVFAAPVVGQSHRFGVIGIGAFGRLGSVPGAFEPGIPLVIEATVQWPIIGPLQLATSADLTVQRIGTTTSFASLSPGLTNPVVRRPFSFDVVQFSVGPAFTSAMSRRARLSGSIQAALLVPSWGSTAVGVCGGNCALLEPSAVSQQTEFHWGTAGRLRLTFGDRGQGFGLELMGIVGPHHSKSRIPLSSIALMLVVGAS